MDSKAIKGATMKWVERMVIQFALCPFAAQSIANKRLHQIVLDSTDRAILLQQLMEEIFWLELNPSIESSLVTVPNGLENFEEYLNSVDQLQELLITAGFEGVYQIASFHPKYQFAGIDLAAAENFTNRSPYPIFHFIREESLTKAIDSLPSVSEVPAQNIEKMEKIGVESLLLILQSCYPH